MQNYNTQHKFMQRAIELSQEGMDEGDGGPFGAVVVRNNKIISEGWNMVVGTNDPTAHAEITVIRKACLVLDSFQLEDCEIYSSCEPCPMCLGAIYWARPKVVYFANTKDDAAKIEFDDSFIYNELANSRVDRSIPFIQMDNTEAYKVFKAWQHKSDKQQY